MKKLSMFSILFALVFCRASLAGVKVDSSYLYDYDKPQALNDDVKLLDDNTMRTRYHVAFDSTNGQRMTAYFYVPKNKKGPLPTVIVMHGSGGSKDDFTVIYDFLVLRGYAVLAVDAAFHGERAVPSVDVAKIAWVQYRNLIMQTVVDLRHAVDWLESRPEVDPARIAYLGISQGTFIGVVFVGVEKRIATAVFLIGGADFKLFLRNSQIPNVTILRNMSGDKQIDELAESLAVIDPQYYIGEISPRPVMLMNGRQDHIVSPEAGARLQELAKEPKETYWYDGGHIPPMDKALMLTVDFLKKNLKKGGAPVKVDEAAPAEPPVITATIDADTKNPEQRFFTIHAKTEKPLPAGLSVQIQFPKISDMYLPMYDDGKNGDAKAGDGEWTRRFELGPHPVDLDIVGGSLLYEVQVVAVDGKGRAVAMFPLGTLTGAK